MGHEMPAVPLILGLEFQRQIMMTHSNSFKYVLVLGALLLCTSSIGLGQLASDSTCVENCDHPGYRLMTQDDAGTIYTREYILHVPSNYDQNQSYPLVIVYHGFGDCAAFWAMQWRMCMGSTPLLTPRVFWSPTHKPPTAQKRRVLGTRQLWRG